MEQFPSLVVGLKSFIIPEPADEDPRLVVSCDWHHVPTTGDQATCCCRWSTLARSGTIPVASSWIKKLHRTRTKSPSPLFDWFTVPSLFFRFNPAASYPLPNEFFCPVMSFLSLPTCLMASPPSFFSRAILMQLVWGPWFPFLYIFQEKYTSLSTDVGYDFQLYGLNLIPANYLGDTSTSNGFEWHGLVHSVSVFCGTFCK